MFLQLGEVRAVGIEVISNIKQDFVIENCDYVIMKDNIEIDKGYATIIDHKISTLFTANENGRYYVIFKYHIGPEIFKAKIYVEVE